MKWTLFILCLMSVEILQAQQKKFIRLFQFSLAPGISTNGVHPGGFTNFFSGVDFLHINHERKKFTKEFNILSRPHVSFGSRLHPKNKRYYFFASLAYNIYRSEADKTITTLLKETSGEEKVQHWPGFSVGLLIQD
ncbi:MAG: hypothetical protein WEB30_08520 [Cyclobacteriaceae bacterium]